MENGYNMHKLEYMRLGILMNGCKSLAAANTVKFDSLKKLFLYLIIAHKRLYYLFHFLSQMLHPHSLSKAYSETPSP